LPAQLFVSVLHLLKNAAKNVVTLFHRANNAPSTRVQTLLKQANATAATTATEDQASSHQNHSSAAKHEFELDVTESAPTSDQLTSILEFVGDNNAGTIVEGATNAADAQRRLRADANAFIRPLVSLNLVCSSS
jgi:hypothetical protein